MFRSTPNTTYLKTAGISFIEVLVTAALVALVFGGLFGAVQAMIALINDSKAKAAATSLATERLEFIRSLSYNAVGTVGSPPFGSIPQNRTVTLNDINFQERVVIRYVDDPADGLAGADANTITTDYKEVKVEYSWFGRRGTSTIAFVTNVVPPGLETNAGGGTIRVYVNDANVNPVANPSVTISNNTLPTTTLTTQFGDGDGEFVLSGLPAGGGYNISVTLPGYSTDGTSIATGTLSSPAQPIVSVAESAVTTQYFQIDRLSTLAIETNSQPTFGDFTDTFTTGSTIASTSNTVIGSGDVVLSGSVGSYAATGTVIASTTTPSPIESWYTAEFFASTTATTSVALQMYYPVGTTSVLVSDTDLPGNSSGFTSSPIDISGLSAISYPSLRLGARLTSASVDETPVLESWTLTHIASQPSLSGVPITVVGSKVLGTDTGGGPVYKNEFSDSTDGSGELTLADIEYDVYSITIDDPLVDVLEVCPSDTINLEPNTTEPVTFTIGSIAGPRLLVFVTDILGNPIAGATVQIDQGGFSDTQSTSLCGQTMFSAGLLTGSATVTVTRFGYTTSVTPDVPITSTSTYAVQLN